MSIDLSARHGPLKLNSPIIVGSCPLTAKDLQQIAMVNFGAGAIVLPSVFEEQVIVWNHRNGRPDETNDRSTASLEDCEQLLAGHELICVDSYLELVERTKSSQSIPVIASLNGNCRSNHWEVFAAKLAEAGADAIELQLRRPLPEDFENLGGLESGVLETVNSIKQGSSLPVFLKLFRDEICLHAIARRLHSVVDGLVLFGRSPLLDIELDHIQLSTKWGLTTSGSIVDSLHAIMQVHHYFPDLALSANGGIGNSGDVAKVLLAGASTAMVTSAVYRDGPTVIGTMIEGLTQYMEGLHVKSLNELAARGSHLFNSKEERIAYIHSISSDLREKKVDDHLRGPKGDCWGHLTSRSQ